MRACRGKAWLLDSTLGRVALLLLVALAHAKSELEANVERLFDEGGSVDQGDFGTGEGQETGTEIVTGVRIVVEENVAAEKPKHPRKKRQAATDDGEQLASSILNVESGVKIVATLPFVTSYVSATPKHESGVPADSITGPNLRLIGASERFVVSSYSSYHSSTNAFEAEGDSIIMPAVVSPVMTEAVITTHVASIPSAPAPEPSTKVITLVYASMFHDSDSTGTMRPDAAGSSHVPWKELLRGSQEVDSESLYNVFVSRWNILNDALLDNLDASREFIDHLAPLNKRRRLEFEFEKQSGLLKAKDDKVKGLKARLILKEAEAAEVIRLRAKVSKFKVTEKSLQDETNTLKERNTLLKKEQNALDAKMTDLKASTVAKERKLTDLNSLITYVTTRNDILVDRVRAPILRFFLRIYMFPHNRRWLLAQGMKLMFVKCLNSPEYLSALRAAINKAIEKGMQDGLSVGITHGKEGTKSTSDIVSAAANTIMALSTTLAFTSTVPPITIEDYEVIGTDGPEDAQGSGLGKVASIPNTVEFEKELLDTTSKCEPPS
uniref:Reverse transcriptase domain-containing protein n=1 Tax=Tanacetum cinerariifolium TaxID=118510 RepID=A0A6L2JJH8_TANCI|nr:reverse transcriptase domain-containing protein [Tanacetum cinerariifolium]